MSLEYAILGFLNYGAGSGYDLKRSFDYSVRNFWPADQSHIYRILSRLAKQGLVTVDVVHQASRPNRKVYHITDAGRAALRAWMGETPPMQALREAFLIQVFFAGLLDDQGILDKLDAKADELRERRCDLLAQGQTALTQIPEAAQSRDVFFGLLPLDYALWMTGATLDWVAHVADRVRNRDYESGGAAFSFRVTEQTDAEGDRGGKTDARTG